MALADDVQDRVPEKRLIALTNPRVDQTGKSVDTTLLGKAVTDATALFQKALRKTYDSTDTFHVSMGVRMVVAILEDWNDSSRNRVGEIVEELDVQSKKQSAGVQSASLSEADNPFGEELDDFKLNYK